MMMAFKLLTTLLFCIAISGINCEKLEAKLSMDPELSQVSDLISKDDVAKTSILHRGITLFAPTNEAFQRYKGNSTQILYHMTTTPKSYDQLTNGLVIPSDYDGNPPLFITRRKTKVHDDVYVNNALIIKSLSNKEYLTDKTPSKKQYMHLIDDVLTPLTPKSSGFDMTNPDAYQFITQAENFENIGSHRIRSFRQKILTNKREHVYQADGYHTFFIPVEEGFKPPPRPDLIDKKVIDGHIIPNKVFFTAAAPLDEQFETAAFEDNLKVTITFFTQQDGKHTKLYVKSNTLIGDSKHSVGVVIAEIVKANIPVKNGVVHLIHRPLMIVDTTVKQFLEMMDSRYYYGDGTKNDQEKEDGPLHKFYDVIINMGGDFMQTINSMKDVTLFAPSNDAWSQSGVRNVLADKEKMKEILNLHLVHDRLNSEKIRNNNHNQITTFPTYVDRKFLYFNVLNGDGSNKTITVEGGGVNATIIQSDIAATNGFVHIIDRVLGIPYQNVREKLMTDPMLNDTYWMGTRNGFNEKLNSTTGRFTFFVPRDKAWQNLENEFPSVHKKLFMNEFSYHANNILQRHLVVADKVFTMNELNRMSVSGNGEFVLPTVRDSLKIKVREEDKPEDDYTNTFHPGYSIMWNNRKIYVFRPDVMCTNGIIHVIDRPFLEEGDIRVTYSTASSINLINNILLPTFMMALLARLFI